MRNTVRREVVGKSTAELAKRADELLNQARDIGQYAFAQLRQADNLMKQAKSLIVLAQVNDKGSAR